MAFILEDRVREGSTTTGTGALTLNGTLEGFRTFDSVLNTGDTTWYCAVFGADWEVGLGTFTAPDALTRTTVLSSSNGGSAVDFPAGTKDVFITVPGSALEILQSLGSLGTAASRDVGIASGNVPVLDGAGKLAAGVLPAIAVTDTYVVASQAAMLALTAQRGDVAVRTDLNKSYILATDSPGTLADWTELLTPTDLVLSVAGLTGTISASGLKTALALTKGDVGLGNVPNVDSQNASNLTSGTVAPARGGAIGTHDLWIPASALRKRTTNGPGDDALETATNKNMLSGLGFDASTIEYAQCLLRMPPQWNEGTVTMIPVWRHPATTTNFKASWGLQGVSLSDGDAGDAAFGTAQFSNDTGGTTGTIYVGPETSAITIAGSPAAGDLVCLQVLRKADDATNDTLAVDAILIGIVLRIVTDSGADS